MSVTVTPAVNALVVSWTLPKNNWDGRAHYCPHGTGQWIVRPLANKGDTIPGLDPTINYDVRVVYSDGTVSATTQGKPKAPTPPPVQPPTPITPPQITIVAPTLQALVDWVKALPVQQHPPER